VSAAEGGAPTRRVRPIVDDDTMLRVSPGVAIPRRELDAKASRAGGPGGQHVNTSSTRVEVTWNVRRTSALTDAQRVRVLERLAARLDSEGFVRVVASDTRSQTQNRALAEERLAAFVARALVVPKVRRATKPSRGAKAARLDEKRKAGEKKASRRLRPSDD
jgi:ribosome-associated protein